jgi:hypothetical protein
MVTIRHGGNIQLSTSQETHRFAAVRKRLFSVGCCLSLLFWCSNKVPAADNAVATGREPLKRSRVVIAEEPGAAVAFIPQAEKIPAMIQRGLTHLTGKPTLASAWFSLVSTQDTVGLKVFSAPGPMGGTRPAVVEAVVKSLLAAGQPPRQIVVWDKHLSDLRQAGFFELAERFGVRVAGAAEAGYDEKAQPYESSLLGQLVWGDLEFGQKGDGVGRKSYVSKLVTQQMTKIINITPLLNHNFAGVSGNLWGLAMGSVDNTIRFENDAERLATSVPEIIALPALGDRVVLNIVDALICQYQGEEKTRLHDSAALNQLWFSADPVALDVLSIEELARQRKAANIRAVKSNLELYQNAALLEIGVSDPSHMDVTRLP